MAAPRPSRLLAAASALARAGLRPERPDRLPRAMLALAAYGPTMAGGIAAATARYPLCGGADRRRRVDHVQPTFGGPPTASGASLRGRGVGPGSTVGILARNGRASCVSFVARGQGRRRRRVPEHRVRRSAAGRRRRPRRHRHILHDDVFADIVADVRRGRDARRQRAAGARPGPVGPFTPTRQSGARSSSRRARRGDRRARARQRQRRRPLTPLLEVVPIRARDTVVIAAPLFHAWGLVHMGSGSGMSSTRRCRRSSTPRRPSPRSPSTAPAASSSCR